MKPVQKRANGSGTSTKEIQQRIRARDVDWACFLTTNPTQTVDDMALATGKAPQRLHMQGQQAWETSVGCIDDGSTL